MDKLKPSVKRHWFQRFVPICSAFTNLSHNNLSNDDIRCHSKGSNRFGPLKQDRTFCNYWEYRALELA